MRPNPRLPWVGAAAFSHKGGTHVNAVQKVHPELRAHRSGARRQHAPRAHQRPGRPQQHRHEGARARLRRHERHAASCATMLDARSRSSSTRATSSRRPTARWRCSSAARSTQRAAALRRRRLSRVDAPRGRRVGLRGDGQGPRRRRVASTRVAEGDGPVNALDAALRAALVRLLPAARATCGSPTTRCASSTRERHGGAGRACSSSRATATREWGTVGVNDNIVEASLQALVDSLEYAAEESTEELKRPLFRFRGGRSDHSAEWYNSTCLREGPTHLLSGS